MEELSLGGAARTTNVFTTCQSIPCLRSENRAPGLMLDWVCRDNLDYLDLTQDRLEMNPQR